MGEREERAAVGEREAAGTPGAAGAAGEPGERTAARRESHPEPSRLRELIERLEDRREHHREHGTLYRVAFAVAGFTVLLGGIAMLLLPGPALLVIPIGLAMLALEFAWAEEMLETAVEKAEAAGRAAEETSKKQRIVGFVAIGIAVAAAVAAALVWDIPLLPV
jgi:uncharacterized protein (TIGR02611 family)